MWAKLLQLFYTFFLIGLFTIGGGYAMIPMIQDKVVSKGWLSYEELMNFFAIAESTPGPFAVNTATLVGFSQLSASPVLGAIVTTIAVILPSFIIILFIAKYFNNMMKNKFFKWALYGIKAVVIGLILSVVWTLVKEELFIDSFSLKSIDIYVIIIIVIVLTLSKIFKKIGTIPLILISGLLGFIFYGLL
jgi:chromate transporter